MPNVAAAPAASVRVWRSLRSATGTTGWRGLAHPGRGLRRVVALGNVAVTTSVVAVRRPGWVRDNVPHIPSARTSRVATGWRPDGDFDER